MCGAQSARPLHGPTRAPIGAERARQSGLGSLGTCPGARQDGCRGPAAGDEGELQAPERTSPPGGICSGVTGDGWVCVATCAIVCYWRSGTLLGPSRALAQRCAAGCASGVTARLSVVGRRSCRWRPGAAAASRAYSSPARAPAVNKRSREGDARTRPLNEARPSHRLDEASHASRFRYIVGKSRHRALTGSQREESGESQFLGSLRGGPPCPEAEVPFWDLAI